MQVEAQVLVSLYEARGEFQLNVEAMRRAGLGARFEAFVKLRDKLEKEGLSMPRRNAPLPAFPRASACSPRGTRRRCATCSRR